MIKFRLTDLALRPMAETDLERVLTWRNHERVRQNMYTSHVISMDEHRAWFARISADPAQHHYLFVLQGRDMGVLSFTAVDRPHGRAHWGFYLTPDAPPQGAGTALGVCALDFAFGPLGLRKLIGEVIAFNRPSLRLFDRLGFVQEGRFIEDILRDGRTHDVIRFAHFKSHWPDRRAQLAARYFME